MAAAFSGLKVLHIVSVQLENPTQVLRPGQGKKSFAGVAKFSSTGGGGGGKHLGSGTKD